MRILYLALKYDYGKPEQGYGFEHYNFYHSLLHMGHDILYFDYLTLLQTRGKSWMNRRFVEVAKLEKPHLMFTVLFTDQLEPSAVREVSYNTDVVTMNWFCDDHWRFDNYSSQWAPCFNWVVTTAASAVPKYADIGYRNAIKSQWACNHYLYRKLDVPLKWDVSFIGQPHGNRRHLIDVLRRAGIAVNARGSGWDTGRVDQDEMILIFNQSRVNLNLSNASTPAPESTAKSLVPRLGQRIIPRVMMEKLGTMARLAMSRFRNAECEEPGTAYQDQIKGRNFEVPGCGGFMLSGNADGLDRYFDIGREIACFADESDLARKIRYYLDHEEERLSVAQAGYERTMREHTYVHRFSEIFKASGLPSPAAESILTGNVRPGQTEEIR